MDLYVYEGYLLGGVFKSEFDRRVEVFMKSFMDWSCLVMSSKIRKISSMNLFQKGITQIKASRMVSSHMVSSLGSHGCANNLEKMPVHE